MSRLTTITARGFGGALVLYALVVSASALAQTSEHLRQATLAARVLAYDRSLPGRVGKALVIAVISPAGQEEAREMFAAFSRLKTFSIQGNRLETVMLSYGGPAALRSMIKGKSIDALFICGGLDGAITDLRKLSRTIRALTIYTDRRYVKKGLALGLIKDGHRTRIMVDLGATKAEGVKLASSLLRIATVVGR